MKRREFLKLPLITLVPLHLENNLFASYLGNEIKISIVYNNLSSAKHLKDDWGFSAWIQTPTHTVLFDTGRKGDILMANLKALNLEPQSIDYIILSHIHQDHVGGLDVLKNTLKNSVKIYVPKDVYLELKNRHKTLDFIGVNEPVEICQNIQTTGQHYGNGSTAEQAAIIKTTKGLLLIHGCSHPGVDVLVGHVRKMYPDSPINIITGGFHLRDFSKEEVLKLSGKLQDMNVTTIAPSHCTGTKALEIIENDWGKNYKQLFLGDNFET